MLAGRARRPACAASAVVACSRTTPTLVRSGAGRPAADARRDQGARRRHAPGRGQVERGRAQPRRRRTKPRLRRHRPRRLPGLPALRRPDRAGGRDGLPRDGDARPRRSALGHRGRAGRQLQGQRDRVRRLRRRRGRRYSGAFGGLPAVPYWLDLERAEPHLLHQARARRRPRIYRRLVEHGVPALRATAPAGSKIFVGELAPVGTATQGDRAAAASSAVALPQNSSASRQVRRGQAARSFKKVNANGFAHHPYGPTTRVPARRDIINMLAIRRLGARSTGPRGPGGSRAACRSTAPSSGSRPTRRTRSSARPSTRQARADQREGGVLLPVPAAEELLAVPALRRPGAPGPSALRWAGFQTGLRFVERDAEARLRRLQAADRRAASAAAVSAIWGRVRPGTGTRFVQLQRSSGAAS